MRSALQNGHWGIKEAEQPPAAAPIEDADVSPPGPPAAFVHLLDGAPAPRTPRAPLARLVSAVALAAIGAALAGVGMVETVGYSWTVGGGVFAALALSADLLSLVMPSAAAALLRPRPLGALLAVALWAVGAIVTVANLSGYIGAHDDTFRAGREVQSLNRSVALDRLEQLRRERAGIREARPAAALRIAAANAKRSARPTFQEALAVAERRDTIDAELAKPIELASTTTADPSAAVLSQISGTTISEANLRRVRLLGWLLLPLCGGGVLSLALSLTRMRS